MRALSKNISIILLLIITLTCFALFGCSKHEHSFNEWAALTAATCTESGERVHTCTECGYEEKQVIPAIGHTYVKDDEVAPTCTTTGLTAGAHCRECGAVIVEQKVTAVAEHSFNEWAALTAATCTESGERVHTCTECGYEEKQAIPATGHNQTEYTIDQPSYTKDGEVRLYCKDCGELLQTEALPMLQAAWKERPADGVTENQPFAEDTGSCKKFRIPAIAVTGSGRIVASCDARWNTYDDGYGLDTIFSYSDDGGKTWHYSYVNYLGDNGNTRNDKSTAFIDTCLAVDGDVIYMLVDLFPGGTALANAKPGTGYNSDGYLMLWQNGNEDGNAEYYLKDGKIYGTDGQVVEGLRVDAYFNVTGNYDDKIVNSNLFFYDSPFKVLRTSYLYLIVSTDGGESWSTPSILNAQVKKPSEGFYGVGPGSGLVTQSGRIIFPCYYSGQGKTSVIYSDDGGKTWQRGADAPSTSSEATLVEIVNQNGNALYMFTRYGGYYISYDNGVSWGARKETGITYDEGCQLNALLYSKKIDGKPVILLSAPKTLYRKNGTIFIGTVEDDGSISWIRQYTVNGKNEFYAYACLAELADGSVALLYENDSTSIRFAVISDILMGGGY